MPIGNLSHWFPSADFIYRCIQACVDQRIEADNDEKEKDQGSKILVKIPDEPSELSLSGKLLQAEQQQIMVSTDSSFILLSFLSL